MGHQIKTITCKVVFFICYDLDMRRHTHSGVYGIILNKSNQLLLVRKTRGPYKGKLDLPGGGVESGEDKITCLKREVEEETGIIVNTARLAKDVDHTTEYEASDGVMERLNHIGSIYIVSDYDDSAFSSNIAEEDVSGSAWMGLGQITAEQLSPFALVAYQYLKAN